MFKHFSKTKTYSIRDIFIENRHDFCNYANDNNKFSHLPTFLSICKNTMVS